MSNLSIWNIKLEDVAWSRYLYKEEKKKKYKVF